MFGVAGLRAERLTAAAGRRRAYRRYAAWALLWVMGHVAGGALLGAGLGWLGGLVPAGARPAGLLALATLSVAWGLHHLGVLRLPMPQIPRQVPRPWLFTVPWDLIALGYGLQLGCGFATRVVVATTYAVAGCALLSGSATAGAALLAVFGAARSVLPVLLGPRLDSSRKALGFAIAFDRHEALVTRLNGITLLLAAVYFAAAGAYGFLG